MRRLFALLVCLAFTVGLSGCGTNGGSSNGGSCADNNPPVLTRVHYYLEDAKGQELIPPVEIAPEQLDSLYIAIDYADVDCNLTGGRQLVDFANGGFEDIGELPDDLGCSVVDREEPYGFFVSDVADDLSYGGYHGEVKWTDACGTESNALDFEFSIVQSENTPPVLLGVRYFKGDEELSPFVEVGVDEMSDFGVYADYADAECNLAGGHVYVNLLSQGWEDFGALPEWIGCSSAEVGEPYGFFGFAELPVGYYWGQTKWTDIYGAESNTIEFEFSVIGLDCEDNHPPELLDCYYFLGWDLIGKCSDAHGPRIREDDVMDFGVYFEYADEDCNIPGGKFYLNADDEGWEFIADLPSELGCSTWESGLLYGFVIDEPLDVGEYYGEVKWTDDCGELSNVVDFEFEVVEGDDDDDCEDNHPPELLDCYYFLGSTLLGRCSNGDHPTVTESESSNFGVYFEYADEDCNIPGGNMYCNFMDAGWEDLGILPESLGCSTADTGLLYGIPFDQLEPDEYHGEVKWTDDCDAESNIVDFEFTVTD